MKPTLFSELGLSPEIEKAIKKLGFEQASPIQAAAIPVLMEGKDVVGQSQTGSGKTAAFGIPAIEKTDPKLKAVQVLILCPTRELAVQVSEELHKLSYYQKAITCLPIYGGQSYERQFVGLRKGAQIVVGTPGRVMDHMERGTLQLDQLHTMILDEADVMLNMGFREDIEIILGSLPKERQTVFFSATMPQPIRNLIEKFARNPESIKMEQQSMTVPTVEQSFFEVHRRLKIELLTRLIDIHDLKLGIIFCNTKAMVDELVEHLVAQGYQADRLHGDMSQQQRDRVMNRFRKSSLEFLVATDVAARGIDVDDVEIVINYDIPYDPEDYVHRIGRTGRAGRNGLAMSFVSGREVFRIKNIERFTGTHIRRTKVPTLQDVGEARNSHVLNRVRDTLREANFRSQEPLVERLLEEGYTSTDIAAALLYQLQNGESNLVKEGQPDPFAEQPDRRSTGSDRRQDSYRETRQDQDHRREERGSFRERQGRTGDPRFRNRDDRRGWEDRSATPRHPAKRNQDTKPNETRKPVRAEKHTAKPEQRADAPARKNQGPSESLPPSLRQKSPTESPSKPEATIKTEARKATPQTEPKARPTPPAPTKKGNQGTRRFRLSIGKEEGISSEQLREAIFKLTGVPENALGKIEVQSKGSIIEVSSDQAEWTAMKMKRALIAGKRIKAKLL